MKYTPPVSTEEKRFLARVADLLRRAEKSGQAVFSDFLDLREQELAKQAAGSTPTVFFGGFTGAERVMLGVNVTEDADFPIIPLDFTVYGSFDHRDVLGASSGWGSTARRSATSCFATAASASFLPTRSLPLLRRNFPAWGARP